MATETSKPGETSMDDVMAQFLPDIERLTQNPKKQTEPDVTEETEEESEGTEEAEEKHEEAEGESETDETDDESGESEEEEPDEDEKPQSKGWPESARKRVDKLTAKLREAEESRERAEAERARLEAESKTPTTRPQATNAEDVLEEVWDEATLMEKADAALNWKRWAIDHPDGGTLKIGEKEQEYSYEQVKRILLNADRMLSVDIPKRRQFLQAAMAEEAGLRQVAPEAFDNKSETWKGIVEVLAGLPELKRKPEGLKLAYALSLGLKEIKSRGERGAVKKEPAKVQTKLAPKLPEPKGSPKPGPAAAKRSKQPSMTELLETGGDVDSLTKFFTAV